jgi:hypothetical protein
MPNRERPARVIVSVTEEEKRIINEIAKANNMNVGRYAREMLMNGKVVNVDLSPVKELSGQLGRIGNNINQIARVANQSRMITKEEIAEVQRALGEIWRLQKSMLSSLQ